MIVLRSETKVSLECKIKRVDLHATAPTGNIFVGARRSIGAVVSFLPTSLDGMCLSFAMT